VEGSHAGGDVGQGSSSEVLSVLEVVEVPILVSIKTHRDGRPAHRPLHYIIVFRHVCAVDCVLKHILLIMPSDIIENVRFHLARAGEQRAERVAAAGRVSVAE